MTALVALWSLSLALPRPAQGLSVIIDDVDDQPASSAETRPPLETFVRAYAPGFARLHELGLPKAEGARYVRLKGQIRPPLDTLSRLGGNAWLVREDGDTATVIINQLQSLQVRKGVPGPAGGAPHAEQSEAGAAAPHAVGTWQDADLDADLARIRQALDVLADPQKGRPHFHSRLGGSPTELLLFCAHLSAAGRHEEADALTARLFFAHADPAGLLADALNLLAFDRYDTALRLLQESGGWQAFRDAVVATRDAFGNHWDMAPGIGLLLPKIEARLPGVPEIHGDDLTDDHRALARALAEQTSHEIGGCGFWLLPEPASGASPREAPSPVMRILAAGAEALPLVAALLEDETLTPTAFSSFYSAYNYDDPWRSRSRRLTEAEQAQQAYRRMPRPLTRGEIAQLLMRGVIPAAEADDADPFAPQTASAVKPEGASLKQQALELYAQIKGKPPADLARHLLTQAPPGVRKLALRAVIARPDMAALATEIEKLLLELDCLRESDLVVAYLGAHGTAVRPFGERYLGRCREALAEMEKPADEPAEPAEESLFEGRGSGGYSSWQADHLKNLITTVEALLSDKTWQERLAELPERQPADSLPRAFWMQIARTPLQEAVPVLLKDAAASATARRAAQRLKIVQRLRGYRSWANGERGVQDALAVPYDPAPDRPLWEALLADTRAVGTRNRQTTLASLAADALCALCQDTGDEDDETLEWLPTDRMTRLVIARAMRLLEGASWADLPPLVTQPGPGLGEAVAVRLQAVADEGLPAFLAALSDTEYVALVGRAEDDAAARARFVTLARRVGRVAGDVPGAAVQAGRPLTVEACRSLMEGLKVAATNGQSLAVSLNMENPADGFAVAVEPISVRVQRRMGGDQMTPVILGHLDGESLYDDAEWPLSDDSAEPEAPETAADDDALPVLAEDGDEDDDADFWKKLTAVLADEDFNPFQRVRIRLALIQPAKAGEAELADSDEQEEDDDDDDDVNYAFEELFGESFSVW